MKDHDSPDLENKNVTNSDKTNKTNKILRNLRLPNKKVIPIHTEPISMQRESRQQYLKRTIDEHNPEIWGCILTEHIKKVQKIRMSKSRKKCKTEQKISILSSNKQKQKSVFLLQQYLSRKKRKTQYDEAISNKYSISGDDKNTKRVSLRIIDRQQEDMPLRQKYIDIQMRQLRQRKSLEVEKKIRQLHSLIKWRTKVLDKIDQQLSNLRTQQIVQN